MNFDPKKPLPIKMCECGCGKPLEPHRSKYARYRIRCKDKVEIKRREKYNAIRRKNCSGADREPHFNGKTFGHKRYAQFITGYLEAMNKPYDNNEEIESECIPYWEKQGKPNKI